MQNGKRVLTTVPIRNAILCDKTDLCETIDLLANHYRQNNCDGLFLSAVTYQGVQLPVRQLVKALCRDKRPRFVVVDGAQAVNHVPLGLADEYCDLFLSGCHKWLRAYQPLGLAFCCRSASERIVTETQNEMLARGELDDPLLVFATQLENEATESYSETVNLSPMFTAAAAVRRMLSSPRAKRAELASQMANADRVADRALGVGWRPSRPAPPLRSGVLLLEPKHQDTRPAPVELVRQRFLTAGVALTAYQDGAIRASLPDQAFANEELSLLQTALCRCA